jgi:hypothetical protein
MFCLPRRLKTLRIFAGLLLSTIAAVAQSEVPAGQPPQAPAQVALTTNQTPEATRYFTAVTPQYNFSYGPSPQQPSLPTSNIWNFYMPVQVTSETLGWTTGEYGIGGLYDTFYYEPSYTTGGSVAGGCSWNLTYDSPPYWYYDGGATTNNQYELLSGPILRGEAAIGSVYQSASQQVSGSGVQLSGFAAIAEWDSHVYTSPPNLIGAIYFATDSCYSGDTEYGFAHYNNFDPPVDQFYFYQYSNCAAPSGQAGSYGCYLTESQTQEQPQCSAAVNLPTLAPNSKGTNWYFWYAYVDRNPEPPTGNGHFVFKASVLDPYTHASAWSCMGDPLESPTFPTSTCPQSASVSYQCDTPFPTSQLQNALGTVTAGISNVSNTPPTGRVNPMLRMSQLYILP